LKNFEDALRIARRVVGDTHYTAAIYFNHIGRVHGAQGETYRTRRKAQQARREWEEAYHCHQQAFTIYSHVYASYDAESEDIGRTHRYLAAACRALKRKEEARTHYRQAYAIYVVLYGSEDLICQQIRADIDALK